MTNEKKIMAVGCAAGAAAAGIPVLCGYIKAGAFRSICNADFLHTEKDGFVSECGEKILLRGINLNDDLFFYAKEDLPFPARFADVFDSLEKRFGRYGANSIVKEHKENFVSPSDLKYIKKLGANCVRVPIRRKSLFNEEKSKAEPDFEYLDSLVAACKKAGLYVILDMHSAPGYQNNDSACASGEESVLFNSGKNGFEARNAAIKLWVKTAAHFKNEPAVAAYDLLNRPLNRFAGWEQKLDMLHKFYSRLYKAIRTVDEKHTLIFEAVTFPDTLPDVRNSNFQNIAFGLYSHFHTSFETDSLIKQINQAKETEIPFVICKIRSEENLEYSLGQLNGNGISWLVGDFKGFDSRSYFLFGADITKADLVLDSYETIIQKWSKPLLTENFSENKEMKTVLKSAFARQSFSENKNEHDYSKLRFKVKFGFNPVIGITHKSK